MDFLYNFWDFEEFIFKAKRKNIGLLVAAKEAHVTRGMKHSSQLGMQVPMWY